MDEQPVQDEPGSGPLPGPADALGDDPDAYWAWIDAQVAKDPGPGEDEQDWAAYCAWLDAEEAAGRDPVPPEPDTDMVGVSISLGDAAGFDPALLAAMIGPDGLGGESLGPQFAQHAPADTLPPGPVLAALTEQAVSDMTRLTDDQLIGTLRGSVRLENREGWKQQLLIAEFARRREAAKDEETAAAGGRLHCRSGEFPGEELAAELLIGPLTAGARIQTAQDITGRLPATLAGMADGLIDTYRAAIIAGHTHFLNDPDIAKADEILARFALGRRVGSLARKAAALEMKLAPEAVKARKERAKRDFQRVEARREESGNASLAGREMDIADVIASKAHIDALAAKLRAAGIAGTLDALRVRVLAELTQGRNPLDLINPDAAAPASGGGIRPAGNPDATPAGNPDSTPAGTPDAAPATSPDAPAVNPDSAGSKQSGGDDLGVLHRWGPGDDGYEEDPDGAGSTPRRDPAPVPAQVNLLIPAGTWLGWSTAPGQAAGWGLLDRQEIADLLRAAARHPKTRWCATLIGPDGTAVAHACARGQHPWLADIPPPPSGTPPNLQSPPCPDGTDGPDPPQLAQLAEIIARLGLTFRPIAKGGCHHADAEDHYTPSRSLRHLVRSRTERCDAPGCQAQAINADLDHTIEYPAGLTCQCNLGPKCRRHHRCKQSPGWKLEQTEPGVLRWTLPSGRVHTTRPTVYDV